MASGKGNTNAFGYLKAVYQAVFTDLSTIWQNAGAPATNLYISLHTANPGATGTQSTSEATYGGGTGYARVAVARTTGGFTITSETITNAAVINFGACVGGTGETETYVGIGTAPSGAGILLWFGQLTSSLAVSNGITPSIAAGALSITEG
jgi:hypothetical protein